MPIIKSAIKRARQTPKRRAHNLAIKRLVKQDIKALMSALQSNEPKLIDERLRAAASELDRAVKKGTLHRNTAARRKSRLAKLVNQSLTTDQATAAPPAAGKKSTAAGKKSAKVAAKKSPAKKAAKSTAAKSTSKKTTK